MINACGVDILESSENLVEEKLNVVVCELLVGLNDLSQISFHQLAYHIDFVETFTVLGFQNALNSQNVFVLKKTLNFKFTIGSQ